jgi:Na+/H+ antiporter NhaD/arsenite permease-like protein
VLEAFVFAVFLAPGVAPFVISNPMNMIVAEYAGIGFNQYAVVMAKARIVGDHPRETFADG